MRITSLRQLAERQHGVLSFPQARELGVTRHSWRTLCRNDVLSEVFDDVALVGGSVLTDLGWIKAATLAGGSQCMASHKSSAAVWGVRITAADPIHVIVPDRRHRLRSPRLAVHRPTDVLDLEIVECNGIPTTHPLRTLCDLGAVDAAAVPIALSHFVANGFVHIDAVHAALARHRGRGRSGATALAEALGGYALGDKAPDSVLEVYMANLCRRFGIPALEFHANVCGWEVDFLVVGRRVIIETDGWSAHGLDRDQFERDRRKDAHLRANGYTVLRFTWTQVTKSPEWVASTIRHVIAQEQRRH